MSEQKNVVTVEIAGEEYALRSEATPEYTRRCAAHVDRVISEIVEQGTLVEGHKAAILAALSLTDELFQARRDAEMLRDEIARTAGRLADEIGEAVGAGDLASPA